MGSTKIANVVNNLLNMEVQSGNNSDICDRWVFRKVSVPVVVFEIYTKQQSRVEVCISSLVAYTFAQ